MTLSKISIDNIKNAKTLEEFLRGQIPSLETLGVSVDLIDDHRSEVSAPLAINKNHLGTGFGGSIYTVLVISCYSWLFYRLRQFPELHLVIKSAQTNYLNPVRGSLKAICRGVSEDVLSDFINSLERKKKARLTLTSDIVDGDKVAASIKAEFVALY